MSKDRRTRVLGMFVPPIASRIQTDLPGLLEQERLRIDLSLLARVNGKEGIKGILDEGIRERPELFRDVVLAFVYVQEWVGSGGVSPELAFDEELYAAALSPETRKLLLPGVLPDADDKLIDEEDTSPENRVRFAFAAARRIG